MTARLPKMKKFGLSIIPAEEVLRRRVTSLSAGTTFQIIMQSRSRTPLNGVFTVQRFNATGGIIGNNQGKTPFAVTPENIARVEAFLVACYATLQAAMSVCRLVGWSPFCSLLSF